jgi:hypothetical protein
LFILENFQVIATTEEFLHLELDELIGIIGSDLLNTQSEELVCDMAMEWINHDKEYRQANAGAILEVLRLPLLSPNYLCHTFESNYFLQNDSQCKSVIQEAMKYHTCPTKRQYFTSVRSTNRFNGRTDDCIVMIGGLLSTTPRFVFSYRLLVLVFKIFTSSVFDLYANLQVALKKIPKIVPFNTCFYQNTCLFLSQ